MNFDRNTVFGFIALAVLFLAYFFYNSRGQQQMLAEKARQDSIARANQPKPDTISQKRDSVLIDSQNRVMSGGDYGQYTAGTEQITKVVTGLVTIGFTNKGGQPKWIELKNFKARIAIMLGLPQQTLIRLLTPLIQGLTVRQKLLIFTF